LGGGLGLSFVSPPKEFASLRVARGREMNNLKKKKDNGAIGRKTRVSNSCSEGQNFWVVRPVEKIIKEASAERVKEAIFYFFGFVIWNHPQRVYKMVVFFLENIYIKRGGREA
jgi:hypothetical protein